MNIYTWETFSCVGRSSGIVLATNQTEADMHAYADCGAESFGPIVHKDPGLFVFNNSAIDAFSRLSIIEGVRIGDRHEALGAIAQVSTWLHQRRWTGRPGAVEKMAEILDMALAKLMEPPPGMSYGRGDSLHDHALLINIITDEESP